ncbi:universal stress protein family protein [Antarctobacter heliothermus]|uniref:Universal stress protein family protein n=1 Tax=Antarctobacter heliothermus TaxID=74033 RepID=A0A222E896_9RHOB|nr:universal stress protein [Antarctobacter heliothermus]ASP22439.1 universal stress protein family protein [Antarctobacter heliothermus]
MPIMNLLVAYNGTDSSDAALRYAAALARDRKAHVTAMLAHSTHDTLDTSSRWIPSAARTLLAEAKTGLLTEIEARLDALRETLGLGEALTFRAAPGPVDGLVSETGRAFDMIIAGRPMQDDDEHVRLHPDKIALMSGRPVIVVPKGYDADARHSHAALAWDGGRAAARALSDSLRLLETQGKVSVLTVGAAPGLDDLMTHLARHDVSVVHENWAAGQPVAEMILDYCRRRDPSLLVMGAYEHSKFREDLVGGVTASVLRNTAIPVLLSH